MTGAIALALYALALPSSGGRPAASRANRSEQRLVRTVGPIAIPKGPGPGSMLMLDPVAFDIPHDGWLTGYEIEIVDAHGHVLPHALLHHAELIDTQRRELWKHRLNRIGSISHDTPALLLPAPLGYPVRGGDRLLVKAMLTNTTGQDVRASLRITLRWRRAPNADMVSVATFGATLPGFATQETSFDVPAGHSSFDTVFTMPLGGRLLAAGGHMHDYGRRLTLVLLDTGDTLYDWHASASPDSDAVMPIRSWGSHGVQLRAGQRLKISAEYENRTGHAIHHGGMGIVGGIMIPENWKQWPALDLSDPLVLADQRQLAEPMGGMDMTGMSNRP